MRFISFLIPALVAAAPLDASPVLDARAAAAAPTGVSIVSVKTSGSGCGSGTVGSAITPDGTALTLIFDQYTASLGPGIASSQSSKSCQIQVAITYPSGWQYTVANADYRGYASLDAQVTATQSSSYLFTGLFGAIGVASSSSTAKLTGPMADDYHVTAAAKSSSLIVSPCGALGLISSNSGVLVVNTNVALSTSSKTAQGLITTDSADLKLTQVYTLKWQKCSLLGISLGGLNIGL